MGMNIGYLTAGRGSESDECMTPFYACEPLLKYVSKDGTINSIIAQRVIDKAAVAGNGNQCSI